MKQAHIHLFQDSIALPLLKVAYPEVLFALRIHVELSLFILRGMIEQF